MRWTDNRYTQITGSTDELRKFADGNDGMASKYGAIRYYEDSDIEKWWR